MVIGRFKVFDHCSAWYEEFRQYHRKDGRIVKAHDDLLDATLYFSRFVGPRCTTIGPSTGKSGHLYPMRFNLCSTLAILINPQSPNRISLRRRGQKIMIHSMSETLYINAMSLHRFRPFHTTEAQHGLQGKE
jgi:hypothetical protein